MPDQNIQSSGLFQLDWYCKEADRSFSLEDAIQHYLSEGARSGFDPNPFFDSRWYLETYPDVENAGLNPLLHYIRSGEKEGRAPSEAFDPAWYSKRYQDVGSSPLAHFLLHGLLENRLPKPPPQEIDEIQSSGLFQLDWYCKEADRSFSLEDAIQHYLSEGARSGFDPNPFFDSRWYVERYPDVEEGGLNALLHYIRSGEKEGRAPSEAFDPAWYSKRYQDVGSSPLAHFLLHGLLENRLPKPPPQEIDEIQSSGLFQLDWYCKEADRSFSLEDAIQHYLSEGARSGFDPNPFFDSRWYVERYPDVEEGGLNALLHYIRSGEKEGRAPSEAFDPAWYCMFYEDIARAGVSPLAHFLEAGVAEKRFPGPVALLTASTLFQDEWYCLQAKRSLTGEAAIRHYLEEGFDQGFNPNPYFDSRWYLENNPDIAKTNLNPLLHYVQWGEKEGRAPSEAFDPAWYLKRYPDIRSQPLAHFLAYGRGENRLPNPFADDRAKKERFSTVSADLLPSDTRTVLQLEFEIVPVTAAASRNNWPMLESRWGAAAASQDLPESAFPSAPTVLHARAAGVLGGSRYFFTPDGQLIDDELTFFTSPEVVIKRHHVIRKGDRVRMPITRRYGTRIASGVHLMHEYDTNYFHFVSEVLPRALVALASPDVGPQTPFLVTEGLHSNFKELLRAVIGNRPVLELESGTLYFVDELWYVTDVSTIQDVYARARTLAESALHAPLVRLVRDRFIAAQKFDSSARPWRKIYIHRGKRRRGVLNERDICEALVQEGFELLVLDELTVKTQAHIFAEAEIVVGPTGAGITNIIWCRPGTPVIVLAADHPAMPIEVWKQLSRVSGANLQATAEKRAYNRDDMYAMHDDYIVDLDSLLRKIRNALQPKPSFGT